MWKNLPYRGCVYFTIAANLLIAVSVLFLKSVLPPIVPLFYGLPAGAEQLAPWWALAMAPAAALIIIFISIFASSLTKDLFLKRTLIISSFFITLLAAIAFIKIVLLVGFF